MKNFIKSGLVVLILFSIAPATKAQVPILNSYPSASPTIFLDFDGHTVENTAWNFYGPIYCGASGLTNSQIISVFNRVAEDYRPFGINVTTDSTKYWAAPADKRTRVILTVTWEWYGSAGGVAFIGSFSWGDDTPCFVFSSLLNYNEKNCAEASSHEAGHTLNLLHQSNWNSNCIKISEYHSGVGSGEIGWAPIMGVGYYRNFTLWNSGPNPNGCTQIQNDLSVITSGSNGVSFRPDDHSATWSQATVLNFVNNQFTTNGVVTQNTDQDLFKFTISNGQHFILDAIPYNIGTGNVGSNLDMQVTLYNNAHTQLNVFNPGTLLNSVIDTVLNAGTYFLRVEGKGNVYAPNYASLGSYALGGTISAATLPLRKLELRGELVGEQHKLIWLIDADEQVIEQVLEISRDGRTFQPVTEPAPADRSFMYLPSISSTVQYRIKVTFDNGRYYYSNVVTLRYTGNDSRPKLLSNLVGSNIIVTSPGAYNYAIYDLNGKMAAKGLLTNGMNDIPSVTLTGGMYLIRFYDESNQWTDKFVRQ